jgi:hypothetical protein
MRTSHKTYLGVVTPHGVQVRTREGTNEDILDLRLTLIKRGPTEWMDPNRGPEQLALAILADATGDDRYATLRYKKFSEDATSQFPMGDGWRITINEVMSWVRANPLTEDDL